MKFNHFRHIALYTLVATVVLGCYVELDWNSNAAGSNQRAASLPFPEFVKAIRLTPATNYVGYPGYRVKNADAFEAMRIYLLKIYGNVTVSRSFSRDGATFDCFPYDEQPGFQPSSSSITDAKQPPSTIADNGDDDHAATAEGNSRIADPNCDPDTVAFRRISFEELAKYPTLGQYLNVMGRNIP